MNILLLIINSNKLLLIKSQLFNNDITSKELIDNLINSKTESDYINYNIKKMLPLFHIIKITYTIKYFFFIKK